MQTRRKFSLEYKQEAVQLVRVGGHSINRVARNLGIRANMLSRWYREYDTGAATVFKGQGHPRDEELARLKRELLRVTKERDFLKEAAVFFAKESK